MSATKDTLSYKDAFALLKQNAERLRRDEDIDIDDLVPIVEQSSAAYRVVKERIDAAKQALAAHMPTADETS